MWHIQMVMNNPQKSAGESGIPKTSSIPLEIYSWSGHGNLGDDWIASVASQLFPNAAYVKEKWCSYPYHWGRRCLSNSHSKKSRFPLVLWGGGWLASDQSEYNTVKRWKRHLSKSNKQGQPVFAFGVGLGPFSHFMRDSKNLLGKLDRRIWVRTKEDLKHTLGKNVFLASDCTILDKSLPENHLKPEWDYLIDFPAWSEHWLSARPWLTLEFYRETVLGVISKIPKNSKVAFLEAVKGDHLAWAELGFEVLVPQDISEMKAEVSKARNIITGRLHLGILGALLGKPTLALAYHHKFELLEELGVGVIGLRTPYELNSLDIMLNRADSEKIKVVKVRTITEFGVFLGQILNE
jgi:hypothetical protein